MFEELGYNVYISHMQVIEEQQEDPRQIEAEEQQLEFYAMIEQARERWFELEIVFRQTGDPTPLYNLITQIRMAVAPQVD